jgi:DUF1680 family protein
MPVRRVLAQEKVAADQGRAAIQRGPLVYCAEWPDYQDGRVLNLLLDEKVPLANSFKPDLLEGVEIITGEAKALRPADNGKQEAVGIPLVLIPYYAWANRGPGEMQVWLPTRAEAVKLPVAETDKNN